MAFYDVIYDDASKINEPSSDGTSGQVLTTDGNGGRSWATVSSGAEIDDTTTSSSKVWSSSKINTELTNKANANQLDEWSEEKTLASGNTFTFSGLNSSYSYKLFCDNPKAYISDVTQTGTTVVYTMGGDGLLVGTTKGKLRIIK